jgi:uncharacterized protein (TIGR02118 family)
MVGKLLVTVAAGDAAAALVDEGPKLVARSEASSGAVNVRVAGDDLATVMAFDTEHEADGMITLRDVPSASKTLDRIDLPAGVRLVGAYVVEEVVQRDYERTWSAGKPSPGVSLICLVRRRPDLSWQAYSDHWRNNHGPLALRRQPGFWRYVQNHVLERLTPETPTFDGIGELHFRTAASVLDGMFDSPEGQEEIMTDTYRFMSHEGSTTIPVREHVF